jgi:ApbE superfamily uncharacterized protein (UPF0280 family)
MTRRPQIALLPDGRRLHLQDGPIDLVIEAFGAAEAVRAAHAAAVRRFDGLLDELCAELPLLRAPARPDGTPLTGPVALRMYEAVAPHAALPFSRVREKVPEGHAAAFITPMAAVAGAVADEILAAMLAGTAGHLTRAYVNNGGDIALFLAPGERFRIGLVDRPDRPSLHASALFARTEIAADDGIGGIATSGWRGRSFSLGIADAVTVLAASAAAADAAATIIANAVDLPGHLAITRVPARDLAPDSDLGDRLVTRGVGALTAGEVDAALAAGVVVAEGLVGRGLIAGAALHLAGATRVVGIRLAALAGSAGIASLGVAAISSI